MKNVTMLCLIVFLYGCCDNIEFTERDIQKHPWLQVFTPQVTEFDGVHNIDNDYLRFSFRTELDSTNYFNQVDSMAIEQGWNLAYNQGQDRVFIKDIQGDLAVLKLHYSESGWISIKMP